MNRRTRGQPLILPLGLRLALGLGTTCYGQTPIPAPPRDFAAAVVQSDQYEVAAADDALAQSQDPRLRDFAQRMIRDHTQSTDSIERAAAASGLPPPPMAMSSDEAGLLSTLQSLRGADFDRAYAKQQVLAHHMAIAVIGDFARSGGDPNLRAAAREALPMIQHHLDMALALRGAEGEGS
jgi:putative membrane protein